MVIGLLMSVSLLAQYEINDSPQDSVDFDNALTVKWNAGQLISRFPTVMLAGEYPITKHLSIQHQAGLIIDYQAFSNEEDFFRSKEGYKLSSSVRYYFDNLVYMGRVFAGLDVYFNRIDFTRTRTFEVSCGIAGCALWQQATYDLKRKDWGARLRFGYQTYMSKNMYIEFDLGLGYERVNLAADGMPLNVIRTQDFNSYRDQFEGWQFDGDLAIRITYTFK